MGKITRVEIGQELGRSYRSWQDLGLDMNSRLNLDVEGDVGGAANEGGGFGRQQGSRREDRRRS